MGKIDFEKILTARIQSNENPRKTNKSLNLIADNHFEYVTPVCPNYNSNKIIKQEYRLRKLILMIRSLQWFFREDTSAKLVEKSSPHPWILL